MVDREAGVTVKDAVRVGILRHAGQLDRQVIVAFLAGDVHLEVAELVPVDVTLRVREVSQHDVLDHHVVELEQEVVVGVRLVGAGDAVTLVAATETDSSAVLPAPTSGSVPIMMSPGDAAVSRNWLSPAPKPWMPLSRPISICGDPPSRTQPIGASSRT